MPESLPQGLKPGSVVGCNVRAEARTYLRGNGKGKGEMRGLFAAVRMTGEKQKQILFGNDNGENDRDSERSSE